MTYPGTISLSRAHLTHLGQVLRPAGLRSLSAALWRLASNGIARGCGPRARRTRGWLPRRRRTPLLRACSARTSRRPVRSRTKAKEYGSRGVGTEHDMAQRVRRFFSRHRVLGSLLPTLLLGLNVWLDATRVLDAVRGDAAKRPAMIIGLSLGVVVAGAFTVAWLWGTLRRDSSTKGCLGLALFVLGVPFLIASYGTLPAATAPGRGN